MQKLSILKLGTIVKDSVTGLKGMLTHFHIDMSANQNYLFQPQKLNPETGQPVDSYWLNSERVPLAKVEEVELPLNIIGTVATDQATLYTGTVIGLTLHINGCVHAELKAKDLYQLILMHFEAISHVDRFGYGDYMKVQTPPIFHVNMLFKHLNILPDGFNVALGMAREWVRAQVLMLNELGDSSDIWKKGYTIHDKVRVCEKYPTFWKNYEQEVLLVCPEKNEWRLHSRDVENFPIVEGSPDELFVHVSKFVAGYSTKEAAILAAGITVGKGLQSGGAVSSS